MRITKTGLVASSWGAWRSHQSGTMTGASAKDACCFRPVAKAPFLFFPHVKTRQWHLLRLYRTTTTWYSVITCQLRRLERGTTGRTRTKTARQYSSQKIAMHRQIAFFTLALATADLAAAAVKRGAASYEDAYPRPQETGMRVDNYVVQEYSPVVTEAPIMPRFGLMARQNTFGRGPDTCAFFPDGQSSPHLHRVLTADPLIGFPLRCYSRDATCIYASPFAGCCDFSESCTSIPTTCIDYTDVLKGSCDPNKIADAKTACW